MKFVYRPSLLMGIFLLLSACTKEELPVKRYDVPDIIQPYIDEFIAEGAKRGQNIVIDDLVVEFATNLDGGMAAGLCYFETSLLQLDTTSANWQNNLYSREALVFHELGHCVLDRRHRDAILSNGNIASIMRTESEQMYGGKINNFKRDYYLDELFDASIPEPEWTQNIPPYNTVINTQKSPIFIEEFNSDAQADRRWTRNNSNRTILRVENGQYYLESRDDGAYFSVVGIPFNRNRDFEIETAIRIVKGNGLTMFQWGGNSFNNSFFYGFSGEKYTLLGNWEGGTSYAKILGNMDPSNYNKLTIRKQGENYYFYINEQLFENGRFEDFAGDILGFYVGSRTAIQVDYFRLSYIN